MTSINTNIAATTALRTLQSTNMQLDQTQSRISTGLKIGEAKDNAAYWSIATTLRSDNKALGTVKDALSLGAATVDTAYQGLNSTIEVLNEIKSKLTAATQDNVNKDAVNSEIAELKKQLEGIASSSTFSGENWLSVSNSATLSKSIVSSFTRDANNAITLGTIDYDISNAILYDGTNGGIFQKETAVEQAVAVVTGANFSQTLATDDIAFDIVLDDGLLTEIEDTITINQADVKAIGNGNLVVDDIDELLALVKKEISNSDKLAGLVSVSKNDAGNLVFTAVGRTVDTTGDSYATTPLFAAAAGADAGSASVSSIALDNTTSSADIQAYLKIVSTALDSVTAAASDLGAIASRIELQQSFVSNLMDTIDKGVSGLVDADMNEESTRLQALQVKQQLGVQALSIANQSAQNVLSLFRG